MSLMSFILIGNVLFILFNIGETIVCPSSYNLIGTGCYKVNNGSYLTWSQAREDCRNDSSAISGNGTTHLIALEYVTEKTSLSYWMQAYAIKSEFWIDGIVSTSSWNWSNQSITWYFDANERAVIGNGSNYKIVYNSNQGSQGIYQIADDINTKGLNYICEYQVLCNESMKCQNGARCYVNLGQELCLCASGFTGENCDVDIDECLSSPCKHNGNCTDGHNNYTCDCSNIFYSGRNCEIPTDDPLKNKRTSAFWSVVGIVIGLVVILTLSDLPWQDILSAIGCSCHRLNCCSKSKPNDAEHINENDLRSSDSPTNDQNDGITNMSIPGGTSAPIGTNYHVMNTVWDPQYIHNQTLINPQYNGYLSPDPNKTFNNPNTKSVSSLVMSKQKPIYAVNINESTSKPKGSVDAMVNSTQQLQEQLRNKKARETSGGSTKQLIHSSNSNDS